MKTIGLSAIKCFGQLKRCVVFSQLSTLNSQLGVTLVEVMITTAILLAALLPLVSIFTHGTKATVRMAEANIAMELARELMDEIKSKHWDEWNTESRWTGDKAVPARSRSPVGTDDESPTTKGKFDDTDDYNGWEEDPPQDVNGDLYDGFGGRPDYTKYKRLVRVSYVQGEAGDPDQLTELGAGASGDAATNLKQVTVIVSWGGEHKDEHKVITTCCLGNYTREIPYVVE